MSLRLSIMTVHPKHFGWRRAANGFTVVELMIVLGVTAFLSALILYFGMNYWQYSALLSADNETYVQRLNAQDYIREVIGMSDGLISQNSLPDSNAGSPDPVAGSNYWLPLHAVPKTISVSGSGITPLLYARKAAVNTSRQIAMNGTTPYDDEYVLYINNQTKQLMVRIIANPNVASNLIKTSCPPQSSTASCPPDKILMDNVSSITTNYYSRSGNVINYESIYDSTINAYVGPDFPAVEAVQYTFRIAYKPLFQKSDATINETVVRIALRNT